MSRTVITAVVGVVIAALTTIVFFVSNVSLKTAAHDRSDKAENRAYQVVQRLATLQGLDARDKAERLAARPEFLNAIGTTSETERASQARLGFQKFMADPSEKNAVKPDIIALVRKDGELLAMHEVDSITGNDWRNDKKESNPNKIPTILPAVNVVFAKRMIIADWWSTKGGGLMRIGVAPVIDFSQATKDNPDGVNVGAIVVAYAINSKSAQSDKALLGTEIAYLDQKRVVATSFTRGTSNDEDTAKASQLNEMIANGTLGDTSSKTKVTIDGTDYYAAAVKLPSLSSKPLPDQYPLSTAAAVVFSPLADDDGGGIGLFVLLLGGGALAIALLGIYLTHRRMVAQVDQVEQGVTDIINGNLDRTFRPVGFELDGLSNGLNVMLARLLGRPEPGEEEFDEEGNPIVPGRVEFEETEDGGKPAVDPDIAALAQESEPDYYKRVYTEYVAARKALGTPDDVSFENFIAKLKVNEGKLKAQYQCRAVRFRVITKDGKVSLKPVPIFA
jgi:hypothetical protein